VLTSQGDSTAAAYPSSTRSSSSYMTNNGSTSTYRPTSISHSTFQIEERGRVEIRGDEVLGGSTSRFSISLTTAFVLALLFTYQKLATTSFKLLNCVPIGERHVLFIDGTVDCYQVK